MPSGGRLRRSSKPALDLPPPFRLVSLREVGDAFAHATSIAAAEGADTLVHHAKARGLPVVMISGNPDHMEFAEIHRLQLLRKPFRRYDLYDALDKALASGIHGQRDA